MSPYKRLETCFMKPTRYQCYMSLHIHRHEAPKVGFHGTAQQHTSRRYLSTEALTKQIGHLDEEGAPVAAKTRLELISKGTEAVATEVVVVSDIESRSRIRRPAKQ